MTDQQPPRPAPASRGATLLVTNFTKVIGLYIAVHEMVIRQEARQSVVAFCALTLVSAQVFESIMMRVIDRMFTKETQ